MYLRTIQRRRSDGTRIRYLQLAHNRWDAGAGCSKVQVLYNFGREDQIDGQAISRLISSLSRALPGEQALAAKAGAEWRFLDSRSLGGAWLLDQLWQRLGVDRIMLRLLGGRRLDPKAERVIFAMVANRALEPLSKLACASWVSDKVVIPQLQEVDEDSCYRAMDWLLEIESELAEQVYWATADLLNLEVDLLFFDTTSTYFEADCADSADGERSGFRAYGHSKDHRPDLPQVVIGLAVTRQGIPIRVWTWPGNASDQELIRQVKDDLGAWNLSRVVWVADRGFNSDNNRHYLKRAGGHYIIAEKLRGGSRQAKAALAQQGRYQAVAGNLEVCEVVTEEGVMGDRLVICYNPEAGARDAAIRARILARLEAAIEGSEALADDKRAELAARLRAKPGFRRLLATTPRGLLAIDAAKLAEEELIDGRFLLRTSDPMLSAEDVALGYKQLYEVERAWRDMKTSLDLRPIYHHKQERIRAHVILCWLGLLLIRIAETKTQDSWRNLRRELDKMHLGRFCGSAGTVLQRTETTSAQKAIFGALEVSEPPRFSYLEAASTPPA